MCSTTDTYHSIRLFLFFLLMCSTLCCSAGALDAARLQLAALQENEAGKREELQLQITRLKEVTTTGHRCKRSCASCSALLEWHDCVYWFYCRRKWLVKNKRNWTKRSVARPRNNCKRKRKSVKCNDNKRYTHTHIGRLCFHPFVFISCDSFVCSCRLKRSVCSAKPSRKQPNSPPLKTSASAKRTWLIWSASACCRLSVHR